MARDRCRRAHARTERMILRRTARPSIRDRQRFVQEARAAERTDDRRRRCHIVINFAVAMLSDVVSVVVSRMQAGLGT